MPADTLPSINDRYASAAAQTAPRIALCTPRALDGHWLDASRFFYVDEEVQMVSGAVLPIPKIANALTGEISAVIAPRALLQLCQKAFDDELAADALATAAFAMPSPDRLTIILAEAGALIDVERNCLVSTWLNRPMLYAPGSGVGCLLSDKELWLEDITSGERWPLGGSDDGPSLGRHPETALQAFGYARWPVPAALWSPEGSWLLTHRLDERGVPDLDILQLAPPDSARPLTHRFKYPFPGDALSVATLIAFHPSSGRAIAFDEHPITITAFSPFFFQSVWFDNEARAWLILTDRYWKTAELVRLDLNSGTSQSIITETVSKGYWDFNPVIGRTPNVRTLPRSNEIIWYSQSSGRGHLYLHDAVTGDRKCTITKGDWQVRDLVDVDEANRTVYFLASGLEPDTDPARRVLMRAPLDGSGAEIVYSTTGDVAVPIRRPSGAVQDHPNWPKHVSSGLSPGARYAAVRDTSVDGGNGIGLIDLHSRARLELARLVPDDGPVAKPFTAIAADGVTTLHGVMLLPSYAQGGERFPLIDHIYPGPQVAHQPQSCRSMRAAAAMAIAELGFATIMLDSRGVPAGSRDFHQAGYGNLLEPQLADHAAVIAQLRASSPFVDDRPAGIVGVSGGGAAAARALFDYPDQFAAAVSVCGNHEPSRYIAFWSEKYCGDVDAARARGLGNAHVAANLVGELLLISGDVDDNVPLSQTMMLADALIKANRDFDLLIVPNAGHDVFLTCGYAQRRAWDFLLRHVRGETPPGNFDLSFSPHQIARARMLLRLETLL